MKQSKIDRLRAAGWKVGTPRELLALSDEESNLIEVKLAIAELIYARRRRARLTQNELAKRIGSSQSRVAKMESGSASVSLELMLRAAFGLGVSIPELGKALTVTSRHAG